MSERWAVSFKPPARRALAEDLPQEVAAAAYALTTAALADNPHRIGKPLGEPYEGLHSARRGTYRVLYRIDPAAHVVEIHSIRHRSDAYRF